MAADPINACRIANGPARTCAIASIGRPRAARRTRFMWTRNCRTSELVAISLLAALGLLPGPTRSTPT